MPSLCCAFFIPWCAIFVKTLSQSCLCKVLLAFVMHWRGILVRSFTSHMVPFPSCVIAKLRCLVMGDALLQPCPFQSQRQQKIQLALPKTAQGPTLPMSMHDHLSYPRQCKGATYLSKGTAITQGANSMAINKTRLLLLGQRPNTCSILLTKSNQMRYLIAY